MLRRRRLTPSALALLAVTALGCSGDDAADAERTGTTASTASTATTHEDPFAVPDEIGTAYVERATNELLHVLDNASRVAIEDGAVTDDVRATIRAVYAEETAPLIIEDLENQAAAGFPGVKSPPGDTVASIESIREATSICIVADGRLDFSDVLTSPGDPIPAVVVLREASESTPHNATGWVIGAISPRDQFEPGIHGCDAF